MSSQTHQNWWPLQSTPTSMTYLLQTPWFPQTCHWYSISLCQTRLPGCSVVRETTFSSQEGQTHSAPPITLPTPPLSGEVPEQNPLFCVVTYHPRNPPILHILNENRKILECTPTLKCISQKPVKMCFRRNPNLSDLLVHSRITYPPSTNTGTPSLPNPNKVCSKTDCDDCPLLDKSGTCFSSVTTLKYIVRSRISCKLNNLVYCVDLHTLPTPICRRNLPQSQREADRTSSWHMSRMQSLVCTTFCCPEGPLHSVPTLWQEPTH